MAHTAGLSVDAASDACVICLSDITERAVTVPCNHCTFDFICLVSWLGQNSTCPLCKAEITAVQYDWRSPDDFKTYNVPSTRPRNDPPAPFASGSRRPSFVRGAYRQPRRGRPFLRPCSPPSPDVQLLRRRHIYRCDLFSLHVGTNRISRYQNLTPQMIANSPDLQSRAKMWIRRELRVFSFLNDDANETPAGGARTSSNAEFLLTYILSILKTVDIKSSTGHAEDLLTEFLGRKHTRLFLHELNAWLRSPYTKLEDWDRHVQYAERLPDQFDEAGMAIQGAKERRFHGRSRSPGVGVSREEREALRRYRPD